jgi:hypothetical protein
MCVAHIWYIFGISAPPRTEIRSTPAGQPKQLLVVSQLFTVGPAVAGGEAWLTCPCCGLPCLSSTLSVYQSPGFVCLHASWSRCLGCNRASPKKQAPLPQPPLEFLCPIFQQRMPHPTENEAPFSFPTPCLGCCCHDRSASVCSSPQQKLANPVRRRPLVQRGSLYSTAATSSSSGSGHLLLLPHTALTYLRRLKTHRTACTPHKTAVCLHTCHLFEHLTCCPKPTYHY